MKTRALIRPAALAHNLGVVRQLAPGLPVIAMVKADAYGHGVTGLLATLQQHADALAVARLVEATALRTNGYRGRLLLLCGVSNMAELEEALALQLDILVHDASQTDLFSACKTRAAHKTTFWLKLDSGMHRLGLLPAEYASALAALKQLPLCDAVIGMTHFASADEPDNGKTAEQIACYRDITDGLSLDNHSLANSAGLIAWPAARRGWLRPGLMLYGVNPLTEPLDLQPVMQLEAQIIAVKKLSAGETTGYNGRWCAERNSCVAFVAAGYADGYPVTALNRSFAAVNGVRVPLIGRVSMDTIAIDCTDMTAPAVGDWVELWGNTIPVAEVAAAAGSIPYQLLTGVSARVPRIHL